MKKILFLIIVFLLTGCSKNTLDNFEIDHNQYSHTFGGIPIGISDNGLYFISDEILYYKDNNEDLISLGYINYINGNKSKIYDTNIDANLQITTFSGRDLICYGNRIYMEYQTINHDMSTVYHLSSVNLKGDDYQLHITFDFVPQKIVISNGNIYVLYIDYESERYFIETYNNKFQLMNTEYYDFMSGAMNFFVENKEIIVPNNQVIYENNDIVSSYKIENLYDNNTRKVIGEIQIGENLYSFENKLILFVNENYFYTSSCVYPQTYERYDLNGKLDKSIIINDFINSEENYNHFFETDFSYLVKLRDEDIGYGYSGEKIFEVNFEKGTCSYINY